jgi:hypothetical protein
MPEDSKAAKVLGLFEAARWRFTERGHENHGLVGAFCPRMSERYCCPRRLKLVSAKSEGGGAPLLAITADPGEQEHHYRVDGLAPYSEVVVWHFLTAGSLIETCRDGTR